MFDKELIKQSVDLAEKHRKVLHEMPEKALSEFKTTEYIKKTCSDYPVELIDIGMETGAVYWLLCSSRQKRGHAVRKQC